jgi:hypothetical protein
MPRDDRISPPSVIQQLLRCIASPRQSNSFPREDRKLSFLARNKSTLQTQRPTRGRLIPIILLSSLSAILVAACSNSGSESTPTSSASPPSPEGANAQSVSIGVTYPGGGPGPVANFRGHIGSIPLSGQMDNSGDLATYNMRLDGTVASEPINVTILGGEGSGSIDINGNIGSDTVSAKLIPNGGSNQIGNSQAYSMQVSGHVGPNALNFTVTYGGEVASQCKGQLLNTSVSGNTIVIHQPLGDVCGSVDNVGFNLTDTNGSGSGVSGTVAGPPDVAELIVLSALPLMNPTYSHS